MKFFTTLRLFISLKKDDVTVLLHDDSPTCIKCNGNVRFRFYDITSFTHV